MRETPFYHAQQLGYRVNPFSRLDRDEWAAMASVPPSVEAVLATPWAHLQVMGEKGRGKTTTLLRLTDLLAKAGHHTHYEYLPPGQRHYLTNLADPAIDIALLDEVQRLWPWEKHRLIAAISQRGPSLRVAIGTHSDYRRRFRRAHLDLATVTLDHLAPVTLQQLLTHRLAYFALDPDVAPVSFSREACETLINRFGSDQRAMESLLFDIFARLDTPGTLVTAEFVAQVAQAVGPIALTTPAKGRGKETSAY